MSIVVEVVDSALGRAAAGIGITLWRENDATWQEQVAASTDETGGMTTLPAPVDRGRYRLVADFDPYFAGFGVIPFQSRVELTFRVVDPGERIRVLLMITSASCGTYIALSGEHGSTRSAPAADWSLSQADPNGC